jgi:hypothetical protein
VDRRTDEVVCGRVIRTKELRIVWNRRWNVVGNGEKMKESREKKRYAWMMEKAFG